MESAVPGQGFENVSRKCDKEEQQTLDKLV